MHTFKQWHEKKSRKFPSHWVEEKPSHSSRKDEINVAAIRAEQWIPELPFGRTDLLNGLLG